MKTMKTKMKTTMIALVLMMVGGGVLSSVSEARELKRSEKLQVLQLLLSSGAKLISADAPDLIRGKTLLGLFTEGLILEGANDFTQVQVHCEKAQVRNERTCQVGIQMNWEGEPGEFYESGVYFEFTLISGKRIKNNQVEVKFAG